MSDKNYLMLLDAEGEGIAAYEIKQDLGFLPDPDGLQDGRHLFTVVPKSKKSAMESYVVTRQHRESGQLYIVEIDGTHTLITVTSKLPTEMGDDPDCECTLCYIKREIAKRRQESEEREIQDIGKLADDIKSKLVQVFAAELIRDLLAGKTDKPGYKGPNIPKHSN